MLTRKAVFNALAGFVDHAARIIVGFVITPILVGHMGTTIFGIWQVIFRLYSQLSPLDGRSGELLKWQLANLQDSKNLEHKRLLVGASFFSFLTYLPLLITGYLACIYSFGSFVETDDSYKNTITLALLILGLNTVLISISLHFEAILRGANLFYRVMGLKPAILTISGIVTAVAIYNDYGLIGAAIGQLSIGILSVPVLYLAMKRLQPWFGLLRPSFKEYRVFIQRCKWFTLWEFLSVWMIAGEVIVLGWLASADDVAVYTLTMYAMQILAIVVLTTVSSAMPGMGGLIGRGDLQKVSILRKESLLYSTFLSVVLFVVLIVFNQSFVTLWVGGEYYAGYLENFLISLCALQMIFIKHDAFMLNMALDIKQKVLLGFISLVITLALMYVLIPKYEIIGLCISLLIGRGVLSLGYPIIIKSFLNVTKTSDISVRMIVLVVVILIPILILSDRYVVQTWFELFWQSAILAALMSIIIYMLGFGEKEKEMFHSRYRMFVKKK